MERSALNQHVACGTGIHFRLGAIREIVNNVESIELAATRDQLDLCSSMVIPRVII